MIGSTSESASATTPVARRPAGVPVLVRVGIGNALEWYDWTAYAIFAAFFAPQFFDPNDPVASLMATFAIFAVGFFMRPLGGILFGRIADRIGRRASLTTSMLFAAAGSLAIGVSPTFETAGLLAAICLLVARMIQGLGHGGEVVASYTYIAEAAPAARRGLWSSTIYIFVTVGVLAATLLGAILTSTLGAAAVGEWGWRIPFLLGGLVGVYAIYLRRKLNETEIFKKALADKARTDTPAPSFAVTFKAHKGAMLRVFVITGGSAVFYYTWAVSAPSFNISMKGIDPAGALWASVIANVVFIAALVPFGILSDRIGRRALMLMYCAGAVAFSFPLTWLIRDQAWQLGIAMSGALIIIATLSAVMPAYFSEMFPTAIRASCVGIPYSLGTALFGGTAPYLQTWLTANDRSHLYVVYTMVLAVLVAWAVLASPETRGRIFK